jgi:PAS domain S-box-containing protein
MVWQYNAYALPLFFAASMSIGLALFMPGRRRTTGALAFMVLLLLIAEWSLADGLEYMSADLPFILFWDKIAYVGLVSVPVAYLIFILYHTNRNEWLTRRTVSLLFVIPTITLLLRWTDDLHHLIYSEYGLVTRYGLSILQWTWGVGFYVDAAYSYALGLFGIALLVQQFSSSQGLARRQSLILAFSISVPLVASIVMVLNVVPYPVDWTSLAFTITGLGFFWAVFRFRLLELMPIAREAIIRGMADGVIVLDSSDRLVDINPAGESIFGSAAGIIGKQAAELFEERGLNPRCLTNESSEVNLKVNGIERSFDLTFSDLRDKHGGLIGSVGVLRDITDLATSERKNRLLLDNIADYVFTIDLQGNFTFASPQTEKATGYSAQQLLSMNIRQLVVPEDLPRIMQRLAARDRGETDFFSTEFDIMRSDGTRLPIEIRTKLLTDGNKQIGVQGIGRDVSERKRMEDALRLSEERLKAIFQSVNVGIMIIDPKEHVIIDVNPVALKMVGAKREQIVGSICHKFVCPAEKGRCPITDLGQVVDNAERTLLRVNEGPISVLKSVTAILNGNEYLLESFIDISERKKLEAQLVETQRLATIGETTTMVGHDLRNPLQAMSSTAYLVKKLVASEKSEDKHQAIQLLSTMDEEIGYMDKIVSDLQDYARPVGADMVNTSLPDLVSAIVSSVKIPSNVQVAVDIRTEPSQLMLDPTLIRRVLTNLILNAIQAMPNGGKLTIKGAKEGNSIAFAVRDTGVGIAPETIGKIFDPFFTTKAQGQGLGLPVCKRLVEAHGGTIDVMSRIGEGSTFTFRIPTKSDSVT